MDVTEQTGCIECRIHVSEAFLFLRLFGNNPQSIAITYLTLICSKSLTSAL